MGIPNYDQLNAGDAATPITHDLMVNARNSSADSINRSTMAGTDSAKGLLGPDRGFENSLGRGDAMSTAIQQKQGRAQSLADDQMKFNTKMKSQDAHFDQLMQAQAAVGQEQAQNYAKAMAAYKAKMAKKAARAALVGSVLGIAGAIGGGMAGGVGGAMAGQAAGQAAGQGLAGGFE